MAGDRLDAWEGHLASFFTARPDNPFTQTGIRTEISKNGLKARLGKKRTDSVHHVLNPLIIIGPWVLVGVYLVKGARGLTRMLTGDRR